MAVGSAPQETSYESTEVKAVWCLKKVCAIPIKLSMSGVKPKLTAKSFRMVKTKRIILFIQEIILLWLAQVTQKLFFLCDQAATVWPFMIQHVQYM